MMFTLTRPLIIYKNCHLHTPVTTYPPSPLSCDSVPRSVVSAQASGFLPNGKGSLGKRLGKFKL